MNSKYGLTAKLLLFFGLAQLVIALAGIAYALYPVSDSKTESKNVNGILDEIRRNNSGSEQRPQTLNLPASETLIINKASASFVSQEKSENLLAAYQVSGDALHSSRRNATKIKDAEARLQPSTFQQKCPTVNIVGPRRAVAAGTPVKFSARLTDASPNLQPKYEWRISAGAIISGQGTDSIIVDVANAPGQVVSIYVTVFGERRGCSLSAGPFSTQVGAVETQKDDGTVMGQVINADKKGVPGAVVKLNGKGGTMFGSTSGAGRFQISGLPYGSYKLSVASKEYEPYETKVSVGMREPNGRLVNTTSNIVIVLKPLQSIPTVTPTPKPDVSPSQTPTPTASPTATTQPTASIIEQEQTSTGQITVEWPEGLAKDWRSTIKVVYTPPAHGRPRELKEGYSTLVAFRLVNLNGIKDLSGDRLEFKPLDASAQTWSLKIEPEDGAGNVAECTVAAVIKLSPGRGGAELSFEKPQVEVQKTTVSVVNRPLTLNQVYGGSALLGISGVMTLGVGRLRKVKGKELQALAGTKEQKGQRELCYFSAEMDEEVLVRRVTTIQMIVSREALKELSDATVKTATSEIDVRRKLLIQVIPKANFEVIEQAQIEIDPPEIGKPQKLYFDVRPTHSGDGEIWLVARQGQVSLVTLKLTPKIVETKSSAELQQTSVEAAAPEASELSEALHQLSIFEVRKGDEVSFMYLLQSPLLDILATYSSPPIKGDREQYVENLYREIETRWESNRDKDRAQEFAAELRAFGGQLFNELFPLELQRVLWERRQEIKSIMVISTEPFIPWELVHLKSPGERGLPSEEMFLGQMGLVRWLHEAGWPPDHLKIRKKRVRYVIPKYPDERYRLLEAEEEAKFLRAQFKAVEVEPQPNTVRSLLSKPGEFDLLHFACHGAAEQDNISNGRLMLEGGVENGQYVPAFLSTTIAEQYSNLRTDENRPMVVVNACQAGRAGYKLSGVGGFAHAFLTGGAGAFVGTLWSVGDSPARVFTETLYKELLNGSNLSEAAIKARAAAQKEGVATWLAYVVYGHPHMKISG
jgi:hypothetical protein